MKDRPLRTLICWSFCKNKQYSVGRSLSFRLFFYTLKKQSYFIAAFLSPFFRLFRVIFEKSIDKPRLHCYNTKAVWSSNCIWGYSSAGRALEWHSRGQRFDPAYLHHADRKVGVFLYVESLSGKQTTAVRSRLSPPRTNRKVGSFALRNILRVFHAYKQ